MNVPRADASSIPPEHAYGDFGTLFDRAGREVWARGPSWRLNHATQGVILNWRRIGKLRPATL